MSSLTAAELEDHALGRGLVDRDVEVNLGQLFRGGAAHGAGSLHAGRGGSGTKAEGREAGAKAESGAKHDACC